MRVEIEAGQREGIPKHCPRCDEPLRLFLFGQVGRSPLVWWAPWRTRPCMSLICWACKSIIGHV